MQPKLTVARVNGRIEKLSASLVHLLRKKKKEGSSIVLPVSIYGIIAIGCYAKQ